RGGRVVVSCNRSLIPLLLSCTGIDELVPFGSRLPVFDVYAMMMSLPYLFRTTLSTLPDKVPYLFADSDLVERWRQQIEWAVGSGQQTQEVRGLCSPPHCPLPTAHCSTSASPGKAIPRPNETIIGRCRSRSSRRWPVCRESAYSVCKHRRGRSS